MHTECWWQEASITDGVFKNPSAYEFIQTTRLLRHFPNRKNKENWADRFDFQSSLHLSFPETEVESLNFSGERIAVCNLMLGLTGNLGVLPYVYTQKIKQAPRQQRQEIQAFLNLFNHKLNAQYVDASLCYHLPMRYEIEEENQYLDVLHNLTGYIRNQHLQYPLDDYFAEFSGLMQGQNNSAHSLKTILTAIFKQQVKINQFQVEKFELSIDQRSKLGAMTMLGVNSFCGEAVRQADGKIEIEIGPLSYVEYYAFLPHQQQSNKLKNLLQTWCSPTLLVDLRLVIDKASVVPMCLSSTAGIGLGYGSFLMPTQQQDRNDTCYALIREETAC